jgi:hypothetical protein
VLVAKGEAEEGKGVSLREKRRKVETETSRTRISDLRLWQRWTKDEAGRHSATGKGPLGFLYKLLGRKA